MENYKDLIQTLREETDDYCKNLWPPRVSTLKSAAAAIEELQKQVPKRGKWIHDYLQTTNGGVVHVYRCSVCNMTMEYSYPFCPLCGAYTRGDSDD